MNKLVLSISKIIFLGLAASYSSAFAFFIAPYKYHDERTQLSDIYSRDENYIYYKTERIEGADPNSFMVTEVPSSNPRYRVPIKAKDRFACYEEAKHVECKKREP